MKRSFHIGIACACGAGIGTLIALSVGPMLWWLGALAGALVGYLVIDFQRIPAAVKSAWVGTFTWWGKKENHRVAAHALSCFLSFVCWIGVSFLLTLYGGTFPSASPERVSYVFISLCAIAGMAAQAGLWIVHTKAVRNGSKKWYASVMYGNILFACFYFVPKILLELGKDIALDVAQEAPTAAIKFAHFVGKVFRAIHSDVRVLCAVDAALGTCVGYFLDHVFYGVAFGFLFGFVNYEIISKRVLKCVQARS